MDSTTPDTGIMHMLTCLLVTASWAECNAYLAATLHWNSCVNQLRYAVVSLTDSAVLPFGNFPALPST